MLKKIQINSFGSLNPFDLLDCTQMIPYFRNVSTGAPTKVHLLNKSGYAFCGFSDFGAELIALDRAHARDFCAKCLNSYVASGQKIIIKEKQKETPSPQR